MKPLWRRAASLFATAAARTGMTDRILARRRRARDYRVFILEYHDVSADVSESEGRVSRVRFQEQLRFVGSQCRFVSLSEAVEVLRGQKTLSEDLAAITFDDGTRGNYEAAWPFLKEEAIPATIFVSTGFLDGGGLWFDLARRCLESAGGVRLTASLKTELTDTLGVWSTKRGRERAMERLKRLPRDQRNGLLERVCAECPPRPTSRLPVAWGQLREMHASGIEIGCHTATHPILSTLLPSQQEEEIVHARNRIAEELGELPRLFAYPNGSVRDFNGTTVEILRRSGFLAACTSIRGSNSRGCNLFELKRIGIGADSESVLAARLAGLFDDAIRPYLRGAG